MTIDPNHRLVHFVRALVGAGAVVVGLGVVLVTIAVGHCSAFGGRCPGDSAFDGEVFFSAAGGGALAIGVPMLLRSPSLKQLQRAVVVAAGVGALVGGAAVVMTSG